MKKLKIFLIAFGLIWAGISFTQEQNQDQSKQEEKKEAPAKAEEPKQEKTEPPKQAKPEEMKMDIVVTASRFEKPAEEIAKSVVLVKKKELESQGVKTLSEALANTPGVITTQTGGYGGETGIYIRGGLTEQVLIMVDGIEANDPMALGRSAQAELFAMPGVDRVEILQGPASALYGSDAEAGVINIVSERPRGGPGADFYLEGGSFDTYQELGEFYLGRSRYFADFSVGNFSTSGISTASERMGNDERDGYKNLTFSLKAGGQPASWLELEGVGKAISAKTDLDTVNLFTGLPEDDPNYTAKSTIYLSALSGNIYTGDFKQKLEFQYADHLRVYDDDPDQAHPNTSMEGDYKSNLRKLSWQGEYTPDLVNRLVLGLEYQDESGKSDVKGTSDFGPYQDEFDRKTLLTRSAFLLWDHHQKAYGFLAGGRADDNEQFGNYTTGEFSGYFQPIEIGPRIRASYGTGFKAPSLYQLYGTVGGFQVGNPELDPEESESWEVGLDQELFDGKVKLSATYFEVRYSDLIVWDNLTYSYNNIAEARANGWEAGILAKPIASLDLNGSYTFVDARDQETGEKLIRRWGEKYGFGLAFRPIQKIELNLWGIHRGETEDQIFEMFAEKRVEMEPYTVVNAGAKWQARDDLALNFRAENIFDEEYYEVYGYGTMPQTFYLGVSYNLEAKAGK